MKCQEKRAWGDIERRDACMMIARRYARADIMKAENRIGMVKEFVRRAKKYGPIGRIQKMGIIELLGWSGAIKVGIVEEGEIL